MKEPVSETKPVEPTHQAQIIPFRKQAIEAVKVKEEKQEVKQPETQTKESEIELPEETPIIEPSKDEDEMEAVMKGEKSIFDMWEKE
ncbi:hypothetical protein BTGOE1_54600 [Bacillus thuringiensis]|nr:hypothetical protein BTGOE1_54600 [Bacillus thuringiensis]